MVIALWLGPAGARDPATFTVVGLNGLTLAALYFVVASGFTLIFGLMRVVNMAHGSLYLLGAYLALEMQKGGMSWALAVVAASFAIAAIGVVMQQGFLRWNQGQDLRQAMITIAVLIILADQMLSNFGGTPQDLKTPSALDRGVDLKVYGLQYPFFRFFVLLVAVAIGLGLWLWIKRTRIGMLIRAGVDDRQMVSALGVNIQLVFAAAFFVGALLAGFGGTMGGTMIAVGAGQDASFLLNSLIVVIIGGMGSLGGAAVGALALGLVDSYADVYLGEFAGAHLGEWTNYSTLLIFVLMVIVLAVRPQGLFGRPA